jgi:hypothetical protein
MMKMLLTVAVLGSVGGLADLAVAQDKQGDAFGRDVSSVLAKLEAQCAHRRRTMPPDPRDECATKLREAQIAAGQGGAGNRNQAAGAGNGVGAGPGNGAGNGLGNAFGNIGAGVGNALGNVGIGPGNGGGNGRGGGRR